MNGKIILKRNKEDSVLRFHPWIFSGAVAQVTGSPEDGDWVKVFSSDGVFLAAGHYQEKGSITVRVLTWIDEAPDLAFWVGRIRDARDRRIVLGLSDRKDLNAWRLVFAEGDLLPGLVMDFYTGNIVVQCHSAGMLKSLPLITEALKEVFGTSLLSLYHKKDQASEGREGALSCHLLGSGTGTSILEHDIAYKVDWSKGQKTGFFLDQRENREMVMKLSAGKSVLNTFCYTGGFSLAALKGGAALVRSVDSSATAIALLEENILLNDFSGLDHQSFVMDTLKFLKETKETFDFVILDPPAYAKHLSARHSAIQGYRRLNAAALEIIPAGGLLMTFSCSQVVDRKQFESAVMAAALSVNRKAVILARLSQPPDHPVSLFHPEGEYLKGLLLQVR